MIMITCALCVIRHAGFSGCFWFYSACSLAMAVYAYIVIPDNRGLSLVKIERNREGGNKLLEQHKGNSIRGTT